MKPIIPCGISNIMITSIAPCRSRLIAPYLASMNNKAVEMIVPILGPTSVRNPRVVGPTGDFPATELEQVYRQAG